MDTLIWVGQLLLALMILVTLHELGHFGFAKWFKTRVERFIIFFDPYFTPIEKKIGETVYGFGWLPLGGYVKISGMIDESMDTSHIGTEPQPWEFRSKTAWQRFFIMSGGIIVNVLLSFVIFIGVLVYFGNSYLPNSGMKHGLHFHETMQSAGFKDGDVITGVGQTAIDRMDPSLFIEGVVLNNATSATVLREGQPITIDLPAGFSQQLTNGTIKKGDIYSPRTLFGVDSLSKGMPAEAAGLRKGDYTLAVNDRPATYFHQFSAIAQELKGQAAQMSILRGADTLQVPIKFTEQGTIGVFANSGDQIQIEKEHYSLAQSIPAGVQMSVDFLNQQLKAFGQMFKGKIAMKDNLGSVISIGKMFGTTWDWERFWILTARLSMLLAFMNLLPIPGLDGGYIFFLIWEMVTGRRVSDQFMIKAVNIGFFFLMGLMFYALGLDIWRHYIK
jgi:regulator of sigma E protease